MLPNSVIDRQSGVSQERVSKLLVGVSVRET